jgi:hypothetical protein
MERRSVDKLLGVLWRGDEFPLFSYILLRVHDTKCLVSNRQYTVSSTTVDLIRSHHVILRLSYNFRSCLNPNYHVIRSPYLH